MGPDVLSGGSEQLVELIDEHGPAIQYDLRAYLGISLRQDVLAPTASIGAAEVLDLLFELPADSAFIASLKASEPPEAVESASATLVRSRRRWRGWTTDTGLLADIRDVLAGKHSPRPWDDQLTASGRRVVEVLPI